jgi:hypothetical protein
MDGSELFAIDYPFEPSAEEGLLILSLRFISALCASTANGGVILAQAFVKNIVATYIGRQAASSAGSVKASILLAVLLGYMPRN